MKLDWLWQAVKNLRALSPEEARMRMGDYPLNTTWAPCAIIALAEEATELRARNKALEDRVAHLEAYLRQRAE